MIRTKVNDQGDKIFVTISNSEGVLRKVTLIPGETYNINPPNKQKLKHRDRKVIFKGLVSKDGYVTARVQFLDTKRPGKVEIDDLDNLNSNI